MRARWDAAAVMIFALVCGVVPTAAQDASGGPLSLPVAGGSVSVAIEQAGALGSQIVVVLWSELTPHATQNVAFGSFTVDVTSDPFRTTQPIRDGSPWLDRRPDGERTVTLVPPGSYTLLVWIGRDLGAWDPWTPAVPIDGICKSPVVVRAGLMTTVGLTVPPGDGSGSVPVGRDLACPLLDVPASPLPSMTAG